MDKYQRLLDEFVDSDQCVDQADIALDRVCRSCLDEINDDESFEIFSSIWLSEENDGIEKATMYAIKTLLEHATSIAIGDEIDDNQMPRRICKNCLDIAWKSFMFKNQALYADSTLKKCIETMQKRVDVREKQSDQTKAHTAGVVEPLDSDGDDNAMAHSDHDAEMPSGSIDGALAVVVTDTSKSPSIYCQICGEVFDSDDQLEQHSAEAHQPTPIPPCDDRPYVCNVCHRAFAHRQTLTRHAKLHQKMSKNKQCSYCGKCFNRADDLRRHIRIHTGKKQNARRIQYNNQKNTRRHSSSIFLCQAKNRTHANYAPNDTSKYPN